MKTKLKSILAAALCAVGLSALALPPAPYRDVWSSTPDPQPVKDPANVIDWGMASRAFESLGAKHGKFLAASADAMIAVYTAAIEKDPTDCEARICRALAYLKKAGENKKFDDLAKEFGYTFDNDTMHLTGELIQKKGVTPEMNKATDEVCDILLPLMKQAYADLCAIPKNWKGEVAITPDVYPVDEAVYFDLADSFAARAALAETMCVLNMVKGFDVTLDSDKLEDTFNAVNWSNGKRGVQAIFENNPELFSKVRDQTALTEAGDWWASAATLLDQWDKAQAKRPIVVEDDWHRYSEKQYFFDQNFEKLDSNGMYGVEWLRRQSAELINLPYWASPLDYTKINGEEEQFTSFQPLFEGKFLRKDLPEFGVGVKAPYCNEPLIDTLPDSTLCGIWPSVSPIYFATYVSTRWTDIPPYTTNTTASVYGVWYKNMFTEGGIGFNNKNNPLTFAWDNATPITLQDPEFNVRGVTAVFKGWSGVMRNFKKETTWEGSEIPTPIKEPAKYVDRRVELTANFDVPKVTYLDFDETAGKLVDRTNECEIVTENTTTLTTGKVYVVVGDVTLNRIKVLSTPQSPAKLVLCDEATLVATNGIEVSEGNALTICGQALGTGTLEATGGSGAAGIGGGGTVTIVGGTVMATGGSSSAGISGMVTIIGGTVTAAGSDGAAGIGGTVKFGAGTAYGVAAGADEASALYRAAAAYAADPSAAYVALPCYSLKIPEAKAGYTYEVSSMGAQPKAALADQVNTYAIATGATVRVLFTLDEDYVWVKAPEENPMIIANLSGNAVIDLADLPTARFMKKGSAGNPWTVGKTTLDSVTAYTSGAGGLVVEGEGDMQDFTAGDPAPWGTGVSEVEIGEDVTSIGARAFADSQLERVTIPASVTNIGAAAFFGNTSLSDVTVDAMTPPALGEGAFAGAAKGLKIVVPPGTGAAYKAAPGWSAYADSIVEDKLGSSKWPWPVGKTADDSVVAWTNGVGGLVIEGAGAMKAFNGQTDPAPWGDSITEVEIGEDVTSIGANAFNGSTALTDVTLKATQPPVVGMNAFKGCDALEAINVPLWSSGAYKHADGWSDLADGIVEPEAPQIWADGHRIAADKQVGVCSWTWHTNMTEVLKEMAADGRYNGMQLALAPWLGIDSMSLYFGDQEGSKVWEFIKEKIADGSLNVMSTMINFPKEDYTSLTSITNTMGYMYGVANGASDADEQWKTNLFLTAEAARLSQELGVDTLTTEAGFICIDENLMFDRMKEVCMTCAVHGVQILIESGPQTSPFLTNLLVNLEKEGYTNVGINFDPGDTQLFFSYEAMNHETPTDSYAIMKPWIRMVHVKDCKLDRPAWNEDCVWGDGIVSQMDFNDWAKVGGDVERHFLEQLAAEGYTGNILYERLSGDPTLTPERKAEITLAMNRIFDSLPAPIVAESDEFTVDLRPSIELAKGETTVSNVTWSATLWGELDEEFVTAIGWTNLTTGATGVFSNLAGVVGEAAEDADLPKKDGEYVLTHSTGDLKSFVAFTVSGYPIGGETNPWLVGPADDPDGTVAWTDGNGNVYFKPPRSAVSRTGLETVINAMGGASFPAWLVSADGAATNGLVMVIGGSGALYDSLEEALEAGEDTCTLYDVKGCVVNYDGMGHSGTMAPDTFIPGIPTNLTANAYTAFGYEFQGWTTNGADGIVFEDEAAIDDPQAGDVYDLKAVWKLVPVTVGKGVTAYLDGAGTLHVEGEGAMKDFTAADPAPWAEFAPDIKAIEIEAGVTKIGNAAFAVCPSVEGASVLFKDPEAVVNLGAFVSDDGSVTNVPTVKVEIVTVDEKGEHKLRVIPGGWTDAYRPYVTYETVAEALEDGAVAVVAAFTRLTEEGEVVVPPAEVEEIVKTVPDPDDPEREIELTAKYENHPTADGSTEGLVSEIENLPLIVDLMGSNITVTVTATNKALVAGDVVKEMDDAMSNACAAAMGRLMPGVKVVGFTSSYLDMSAFWSFKVKKGQLVEFTKSVIAHIPMDVYDGMVYSVSRQHQGVTEVLADFADVEDGDTAEWVKVDTANKELVVKTRKFCEYALGTLEPETSCTVTVGDSCKILGEADPSSLATNFEIRVTGRVNVSDFAGYCRRTKGEAAGEYAINFVCTRMPQVFDGPFTVVPGTFTITDEEDIVAVWAAADAGAGYPTNGYVHVRLACDQAMGKVKGENVYKLNKKTGTAKVSISATAAKGYVFAGWYEDPGFSTPAKFWTGTGRNAKPKDCRNASQSMTVTDNTYLFARFVKKSTTADPISWLHYEGAGYCGADASWLAEEETWYQGVALPTNACQVAFGSLSLPTVTVKGLPSGVKFDKATCRFTGVPTAASTEKKPFFTVKVTVKNKSGATDVLVKQIRVEPLPAWAVGNFDGYHLEEGVTNGTFAATVGKTGKVSGKTKGGWADTTFSAKNFSEVKLAEDGSNLVYAVDVTVSYRDPMTKKTVKEVDTLYLAEDAETGLGVIVGADEDGCGSVGVQRAWDRKDLAFPAFDTKALKTPLPLGNGLTLKFGAKGKVTLGGKVNGVKMSGTTHVLPFAWQSTMAGNLLAQVPVYVAPTRNSEGFCAVYDVLLTAEGGKFVSASPLEAPLPDRHGPIVFPPKVTVR